MSRQSEGSTEIRALCGRLPWVAVALALFAAPPAAATVYKCRGEQGIVIYQEIPCLDGRELRNFDADPPDLSIIPVPAAKSATSTAPPALPALGNVPAETRPTRSPGADAPPARAGADPAARKFIRQGMTEAEVIARVGRPDATAGGGKASATRWSYLPAPEDPDTVTTVTFIGGVVSDVSRKLIRK